MLGAYDEVTEPIAGQEAFSHRNSAGSQSQAAFLLVLGNRIRPDDENDTKEDHLEDEAQLGLPSTGRLGSRLALEDLRESLAKTRPEFRALLESRSAQARHEIANDLLVSMVNALYTEPTPRGAAELMEVCMFHEDPLVQVAAAASRLHCLVERASSFALLEHVALGEDASLARQVAAAALAQVVRESVPVQPIRMAAAQQTQSASLACSVLVHGTFAADAFWWQPGAPFHSYLSSNVRPNLYGGSNPFHWSGGYSNAARALGARQLCSWAEMQSESGLDHVIAHSHGGSVAMLASRLAQRIDKLVLLSCPVHATYTPDFNNVGSVVSVRVRLDLVILVDGGRQRFRDSRIPEVVLPLWFNHSATLDPDVWERYELASRL